MSQCTFRLLKQFTLVFFLAWTFVVFFANERELVERFARQILSENQMTSERAQKAKEFFEAHQRFDSTETDEQEESTEDKETSKVETALPVEVNEDKYEA